MANAKFEYLVNWEQFFSDMKTECDLFALTVVFKSGGYKSGRTRFEDEYNKVLNRIRKRVDPKGRYGNNAIYFDNFSMYEYDVCSLSRTVRHHKVHHIHALIPIRKCQAYRVWNKQFHMVDPKLKDALNAMKKDTVSTYLLEPVREDALVKWVFYMNKSDDAFNYRKNVVPAVGSYELINKIAEAIRTNKMRTSLSC